MERKFTLKPDPTDNRDYLFQPKLKMNRHIGNVDLRRFLRRPRDQKWLGICTGFAAARFMQYFLARVLNTPDIPDLSPLHNYWHSRDLEGTVDEDAGAYIRDVMKVLKNIGICLEEDWPFIPEKFRDRPSERAESTAWAFQIKEYNRINGLDDLLTALDHGIPIMYGLNVYQSYVNIGKDAIVPIPKADDFYYGAHCELMVGYDMSRGMLIGDNSWGPYWGDEGSCYIPFETFESGKLILDMWTGRQTVDSYSVT